MKRILLAIHLFQTAFLLCQSQVSSNLRFDMALEFDQSDAPTYDHINDKIFGIQEQQNISIHKKYEYGRDNGYLNFWDWDTTDFKNFPNRQNGSLIFKDSMRATFVDALDISGDTGYTLMTKVQSGEGFRDYYVGERYLFWIKDTHGRIVYGLKRVNSKLVFHRYTRDPLDGLINGTWEFDLWDPTQFKVKKMSNYTLFVSVTKDVFRVFVKANTHGEVYETSTKELVYLGGQAIYANEIGSIGFGSPDPNERLPAMYQIDYFRILKGCYDFDTLEDIYIKTEHVPIETLIAAGTTNKAKELKSKIIVSPNPYVNSKSLTVAITVEKPGTVRVEIKDIFGVVKHAKSVVFEKGISSKQVPIKLSGLKKGIYIVKIIEQNNKVSSHELIVD